STRNSTRSTPETSNASARRVVIPRTLAPLAGALIATEGPELSTVTFTGAEEVELPAASNAHAVSECAPSGPELQQTVNGAAMEVPKETPLAKNSTLATLESSWASAATCTPAPTIAPAAGAVRATVGGVVSGPTVTMTTGESARFSAASKARAW